MTALVEPDSHDDETERSIERGCPAFCGRLDHGTLVTLMIAWQLGASVAGAAVGVAAISKPPEWRLSDGPWAAAYEKDVGRRSASSDQLNPS